MKKLNMIETSLKSPGVFQNLETFPRFSLVDVEFCIAEINKSIK
jgi:hypothetical protein